MLDYLKNALLETPMDEVEAVLKKYDEQHISKFLLGLQTMKRQAENQQELMYLEKVEDLVNRISPEQRLETA